MQREIAGAAKPLSLSDTNKVRTATEELQYKFFDLSPNEAKRQIDHIARLLQCQ